MSRYLYREFILPLLDSFGEQSSPASLWKDSFHPSSKSYHKAYPTTTEGPSPALSSACGRAPLELTMPQN